MHRAAKQHPARIGLPCKRALLRYRPCGHPTLRSSPVLLSSKRWRCLGNNSGGCQTSTPQQAISVWRALGFSPTIYPREAAPSDSYYSRSEPKSREACRGICVWDNSVHAWWLKYASLGGNLYQEAFPPRGEQGKHQRRLSLLDNRYIKTAARSINIGSVDKSICSSVE